MAAPESPRFTRLSVEDGLSQSSVQQILQDSKGLLWFGTQEGLNRYDGYRFTVHRARDQQGFLGDHDIHALIEGAGGDLWVGTSRGLYRYDLATGRFDGCAPPVDRLEVIKLVRSGDHRIFFATSDGRLWVLDPADPQRRARALNDGAFAALNGVTALAAGRGSAIWAAAQGRLFKVDTLQAEPSAQLTEALADLGRVFVLATDAHGDVWIGGINGDLLRYRPAGGEVTRFPQAPHGILAILPGRHGELWIGARRGGLGRLNPETGELVVYRHDPEDSGSLSSDDVAAIYEDANGGLWVGSWNGGVNRFDPHGQAFRTFRVGALGEAFRAHRLDVLPIAVIRSARGIAWIASGKDLFRAARGGGRGPVSVDRLEVPIEGSISALSTAASGRLWIGTDRGEIARAEWSGPGAAVAMRSLDAVSPSDRAALAAHGVVSALYEDPQGRLWVGTRRGLGRIDVSSGSVSWLGQGDGLPSTNIAGIEADAAGRLWIGHNRGITRLDPASGAMTHFGERDGAQGKGYAEGASTAGARG